MRSVGYTTHYIKWASCSHPDHSSSIILIRLRALVRDPTLYALKCHDLLPYFSSCFQCEKIMKCQKYVRGKLHRTTLGSIFKFSSRVQIKEEVAINWWKSTHGSFISHLSRVWSQVLAGRYIFLNKLFLCIYTFYI